MTLFQFSLLTRFTASSVYETTVCEFGAELGVGNDVFIGGDIDVYV